MVWYDTETIVSTDSFETLNLPERIWVDTTTLFHRSIKDASHRKGPNRFMPISLGRLLSIFISISFLSIHVSHADD